MTERHYAVDRLEGDHLVVIGDDGRAYDLPAASLPTGIAAGDVLRVPSNPENAPDWAQAQLDPAETKRRRRRSQQILDELKQRDPGGDVEL